ncbi:MULTISPECIES: hypothetical protein [Corynebacterium]|uniref:hypothetical protein n=1 Tax=Corynebacterium TaxID=1716 RepID=UPI0008A2B478|nr:MULTISPECIES: hypothetical protein [Corynebacterium]MCX2162207.1 hypothetical protein [Corynebacterium auriscanis]OFT91165.1 hypothetical protein HMPREF3098_01560 [Corynebacterium sp. HMSC28B08]
MAEVSSPAPLTFIAHEVRSAATIAHTVASQLHSRSEVLPSILSGVPHAAAQEFSAALADARSRHNSGLQALASYFTDAATGLRDFDTAVGSHESDHAAMFRGKAG